MRNPQDMLLVVNSIYNLRFFRTFISSKSIAKSALWSNSPKLKVWPVVWSHVQPLRGTGLAHNFWVTLDHGATLLWSINPILNIPFFKSSWCFWIKGKKKKEITVEDPFQKHFHGLKMGKMKLKILHGNTWQKLHVWFSVWERNLEQISVSYEHGDRESVDETDLHEDE